MLKSVCVQLEFLTSPLQILINNAQYKVCRYAFMLPKILQFSIMIL